MSDERLGGKLSTDFGQSAKDDARAVQRRESEGVTKGLEKIGPKGREALEVLDRQRDNMLEAAEEQVAETAEARRQAAMAQEIKRMGRAPEPGRLTQPLSPAEHDEATQRVGQQVERQEADIIERRRFEIEEQRNRVGRKAIARLEHTEGQGRSHDRGQGHGRDDL